MAQYHYAIGNQDRAEAIMRWLFDNAEDGFLPEIAVPTSSIARFADELRATIDQTQVSGRIGRQTVDEMRARRHHELDTMIQQSRGREVVPANMPYVWAHIETLRALRRGGYVGRWQIEPSAHRSH